MGWGDDGVIAVPVDAYHRMTAASAAAVLARARAAHPERRIIGIVAAAGSTATGAFDPLDELADLAAREGLWLHVDAAHGGGVALSLGQRHKLARHRARRLGRVGRAQADDDAGADHGGAVQATAATPTKRSPSRRRICSPARRPRTPGGISVTRTLECTKRAMAIEVWSDPARPRRGAVRRCRRSPRRARRRARSPHRATPTTSSSRSIPSSTSSATATGRRE